MLKSSDSELYKILIGKSSTLNPDGTSPENFLLNIGNSNGQNRLNNEDA
jgi:hypothetical protein